MSDTALLIVVSVNSLVSGLLAGWVLWGQRTSGKQ